MNKCLAPVAAVSAIIVEDDRILLVQRGVEPNRGLWSLPGGAIELGETARDALIREVREETCLDVEPGKVAYVHDVISRSDGNVHYHYVIIGFFARVLAGFAKASSDAADIQWVPLANIRRIRTTVGLLEKLCEAGLNV
ncbi:MAG: NUDIX hydrolase [Armatimonadota bacterium]